MSKFFIKFLPIFILLTSALNAEMVNKIIINGNERISDETIIVFGDIQNNVNLERKDLNKILNNLYDTNFFDNIKVNINNNTLVVEVSENPIIQKIVLEGIKSKTMEEKIFEIISLKEKSSYVEVLIKNDLKKIKNALRFAGYYFVDVVVNTQQNSNNTINLIYNIDLGEKAKIEKIKFIGDKKFKDRKLRSIIVSEENKPWKFISSRKYLDQSRVKLDIRLLNNFYKNKGYYNAKITNSSAQLIDQNSFLLTYNIDAGNKFYFNNLSLLLPDDYDEKHFIEINKIFNDIKNTPYSYSKIELILDEIDKVALSKQYEFINAEVDEEFLDDNKINFSITIKESEKFYVQRINIYGNNITRDEVIRNILLVDEGDAFNEILHNKSINSLKGRGIFANVNSEIVDGSTYNEKIINIEVEEKATGEITLGAGVGTSGSTIGFGIKENNFMGRGVRLNSDLSISETSLRGLLSVTDPNYRYSGNSVTYTAQSTVTDNITNFGYKTSLTGISIGTSFEQYDDFYVSPSFSTHLESIDTNASASDSLKKQEGSYFDVLFDYRLTYDKRNQTYQPSDGYRSSFSQTLPVVSENYSITNGYEFSTYHEFLDDMVGTFAFYAKAINSLANDDVRISKRLSIPGRRLRGFEVGKVGPVDDKSFVGGNYVSALNINTTIPKLLPDLETIDFKLFLDVANVWGVDYSNTIAESNKVRSAAGIGADWYTPIGPLNFSFSQPLSKAKTDKTETFRFQLGTTF